MSRFFRLYEKKRGNRRTGSKTVGDAGEALFFGIFFAVGCAAFAYMLVALVWPEWRANRQFEPATCVVIAKRVGGKPATEVEPAQFRPELRVRYEADGHAYVADGVYDVTNLYSQDEAQVKAILDGFEIDKQYPCWYDPIDPGRVVLVQGYSGWLYVTLLIPLSFMIIGGGRMIYTLVHWNASDERRSVLDQRAAHLDLFEVEHSERHFPTVPADDHFTNSPGTTLAYRLPISTTAGWKLFAAAAACASWNALVAILVVAAARGLARSEPDWVLIVSLIPFVAAGIALAVYLVRQILVITGVGPTRIEISDHPLVPGRLYELFLSQAGRLTMRSLEVWVACDERATFRQGTDTRTETQRVYQARCFVRESFQILQGLPFESRCQVCVPQGAMHSFLTDHNEVSWKLIVKGSVNNWPDYQREFQIVVNPDVNGEARP
ncbi:MAG: DUF3592 domain-containing protein [Pirellulales bacterium]